jgi:hypothetical protein
MLLSRFAARFHKSIACFSFLAFVLLAPASLLAGSNEPAFAGVELTIPDETVPPGGMLQLKMQITEPQPILKGGQRTRYLGKMLGSPQGFALFSPSGDASGTAVLSKGEAQFSLSSPLFDMGQNIDYPIITIAIPVKATAIAGQTAPLTLDPGLSQWIDPNGQNYPVLLTNGILTVGGTLSISNIVPGGGLVPAGTKISILGVGFQPNSKVQVNEAIVAKWTYVNSTEIDVTLTTDMNMTSRRIRVTNPATNERATYYSYQRTAPVGKSKHPLIAATVPLFSQSTWSLAYFKPVLNGSQFTGLAVQNETTTPATVRLQLFAANGSLLATHSLKIAANRRLTRDVAEFFAGVVPGTGTSLKVTVRTGPPIQLLGLLGDDLLGTVDPVDPSPVP